MSADEIDTTLLVHPQVLSDFLGYNDFSGAPSLFKPQKQSPGRRAKKEGFEQALDPV